jgi:hypothetical protein
MFVGYDIASGYKVVDVGSASISERKGRAPKQPQGARIQDDARVRADRGRHPPVRIATHRRARNDGRAEKLEKRIKSIPVYGDLIHIRPQRHPCGGVTPRPIQRRRRR